MIGRTLVFGGGKINYSFAREYLSKEKFDSVVCADSGLDAAGKLGIKADFLIGDFDSVEEGTLSGYIKPLNNGKMHSGNSRMHVNGMPVPCDAGKGYIRYPAWKDYTDMHLVLEWVSGQEPSEIVILGATGGRLDHFLANINTLMVPLEKEIPAYIIDECNKICLVKKSYRIAAEDIWGKYISLLPMAGKVTGVYLYGMKYPLQDGTLEAGESRTISNEPAGGAKEVMVEIGQGILVLIESRDAQR